MPMPRWVARVNRRVFNPRELRRGTRPFITHVGRSSGTVYRTPLDAHPVPGGFVFVPVYGPDSDWVRNVLSAGTATVTTPDGEFDLVAPRLIPAAEAWQDVAEGTAPIPGWLKLTEYLRMDLAI